MTSPRSRLSPGPGPVPPHRSSYSFRTNDFVPDTAPPPHLSALRPLLCQGRTSLCRSVGFRSVRPMEGKFSRFHRRFPDFYVCFVARRGSVSSLSFPLAVEPPVTSPDVPLSFFTQLWLCTGRSFVRQVCAHGPFLVPSKSKDTRKNRHRAEAIVSCRMCYNLVLGIGDQSPGTHRVTAPSMIPPSVPDPRASTDFRAPSRHGSPTGQPMA